MTQERYLFAIIAHDDIPPLQQMTAFEDNAVEALQVGELAAITSLMPEKKLRPRRSNLKIHHRVIDHLTSAGASALPFVFGSATELEELAAFLKAHQEALKERVQLVKGCVEVSLRLQIDEEQVFRYVVDADPTLRKIREDLFLDGRQPSREEKVSLGRQFELAREDLRMRFTEQLWEGVADHCRKVVDTSVLKSNEFAHQICLVPSAQKEEFEGQIERIAGDFDDDLILHISPYLAPYSFTDLDI